MEDEHMLREHIASLAVDRQDKIYSVQYVQYTGQGINTMSVLMSPKQYTLQRSRYLLYLMAEYAITPEPH